MKKKDAVVGLRVSRKATSDAVMYGDKPWPGTVVEGDAGSGNVLVEWDLYEYQKQAGQKPTAIAVNLKELLPLKDAKKEFTKLEREFKVYEKEVKKKLQEAGKLIRESQKLARKAGADSLHEMYNATHILFSALDDAGWNTSSMGC